MTVAPDASPVRTESLVPGESLPIKINWLECLPKHPAVTHAGRTVGTALAAYANRDGGSCFPGREALAADCRMTVRSVDRHLAALRDAGLITLERKGSGGGRGQEGRATRWRLAAWWITDPALTATLTVTDNACQGQRVVVDSDSECRTTPPRTRQEEEHSPELIERPIILPLNTRCDVWSCDCRFWDCTHGGMVDTLEAGAIVAESDPDGYDQALTVAITGVPDDVLDSGERVEELTVAALLAYADQPAWCPWEPATVTGHTASHARDAVAA